MCTWKCMPKSSLGHVPSGCLCSVEGCEPHTTQYCHCPATASFLDQGILSKVESIWTYPCIKVGKYQCNAPTRPAPPARPHTEWHTGWHTLFCRTHWVVHWMVHWMLQDTLSGTLDGTLDRMFFWDTFEKANIFLVKCMLSLEWPKTNLQVTKFGSKSGLPTAVPPKIYILPGKMYTFDSGTPILGLESWNFIPKIKKTHILPCKMYVFRHTAENQPWPKTIHFTRQNVYVWLWDSNFRFGILKFHPKIQKKIIP